jgi:Tfp pilus assembly protein PilF
MFKKSSNITNRKLIINTQTQLPNISHVYLLLSMAYNKINNFNKSIESANESLKHDSKYEQGYCFRGKLYLKIGENEKAFYDYKQALKYNN